MTEGKLYRIPVEAVEGYLYPRERVAVGWYRPLVVPVQLPDGSCRDALTFVAVKKETEMAPSVVHAEEILRGARPM